MDPAEVKGVADQFVVTYYDMFDNHRNVIGTIYKDHSMLTFEQEYIVGKDAISEKLQNLPFQKVEHRAETADAQQCADDGILVMVTGALLVEGQDKPLSFTQAFQLRKEVVPGRATWWVLNDVFRLVYPAV